MAIEQVRITVFDTTLRDGEQSPGCSMNHAEKLRLAHQIDRLGADVIEAGFPIASDGDFEAVRAIAGVLRRPIIAGLARACRPDIELGYFPSLSRITASQLARMHDAETTATFIYDGVVIAGLGTIDLMPRRFWRKLLAALRLRVVEPWQSIALALLAPPECAIPPIDWSGSIPSWPLPEPWRRTRYASSARMVVSSCLRKCMTR